jgi:hypothetical protein
LTFIRKYDYNKITKGVTGNGSPINGYLKKRLILWTIGGRFFDIYLFQQSV